MFLRKRIARNLTKRLVDEPHFLAVSDCLLNSRNPYLKQIICRVHDMILCYAMESKDPIFQ